MRSFKSAVLVSIATILASGSITACRRAVVLVPDRNGRYTTRDTLYGRLRGSAVLVTFRHDTTWRVDTIVVRDTLWRAGTRVIVKRDTIHTGRVDTLIRRDTIRLAGGLPRRVDTVRVIVRDTVRRVDTVYRTTGPAPAGFEPVSRVDSVRYAPTGAPPPTNTPPNAPPTTPPTTPGTHRRTLHVPPGFYPPPGQCRVWMPNRAPGQQAPAAACTALGRIPAGAFILFRGEAYDFDYDWIGNPDGGGGAPPEILAVKRRARP